MEAHDDIGDHTMIIQDMTYPMIKGKRSKVRRRPSSALQLTLTLASTTSSSSTTTTTTTTTDDQTGGDGFFQSTPSKIEFTNILDQDNYQISTNINNDQDIANCLMLLAHGHRHHIDIIPPPPPHPISNNTHQSSSSNIVYECKTCDRGFTFFQALGGHKASHNKMMNRHELSRDHTTSVLIGRPNKPFSSCAGSTSKVHECSICGSGFTSGQALGGHMRRHRSMTMLTTTTTTTTTKTDQTISNHESKKHKTSLDLNLPAPAIDDDHHHRKETNISSFGSNNQQIIVFSTPSASLVDCHL